MGNTGLLVFFLLFCCNVVKNKQQPALSRGRWGWGGDGGRPDWLLRPTAGDPSNAHIRRTCPDDEEEEGDAELCGFGSFPY